MSSDTIAWLGTHSAWRWHGHTGRCAHDSRSQEGNNTVRRSKKPPYSPTLELLDASNGTANPRNLKSFLQTQGILHVTRVFLISTIVQAGKLRSMEARGTGFLLSSGKSVAGLGQKIKLLILHSFIHTFSPLQGSLPGQSESRSRAVQSTMVNPKSQHTLRGGKCHKQLQEQ